MRQTETILSLSKLQRLWQGVTGFESLQYFAFVIELFSGVCFRFWLLCCQWQLIPAHGWLDWFKAEQATQALHLGK